MGTSRVDLVLLIFLLEDSFEVTFTDEELTQLSNRSPQEDRRSSTVKLAP